MQYELRTRYTVTMPLGVIGDVGMGLIEALIGLQRLQQGEWKVLNPDCGSDYLTALPEDWQWSWLVEGKGDFVGTFPKRVRKFYFQAGLKCPDSFIEEIGRIARDHSSGSSTYEFEVVDSINWDAGDFGDHSSCYWDSNAAGRVMLENNGGLALCFYKPGTDNGVARAWFVPQESNHEQIHILFNGYGLKGDATLVIARIAAHFLNATYKKIDLCNYGSDTGKLWINSGRGYAIGAVEIVESISAWDFEWDDEYVVVCYSCSTILNEYETYRGADDEDYCTDCYYEKFDSCSHCGDAIWQDDANYAEDETWCDHCFESRFVRCDDCGEAVRIGDAVGVGDGTYCESCGDDRMSEEDDSEQTTE